MHFTPEHAAEITRNIERFGEFLNYLIDNPSEMEKIPNGSHIYFADTFEKVDIKKVPDRDKVLLIKKVYEFA